MIPLTANLRIEKRGRQFRLWLPLFALWLLALPFLIVALPVVAVILAAYRRNPLRLFAAYWNLLSAIPGSLLEVNGRRGRRVSVHVC
jgi:hypothetical protein